MARFGLATGLRESNIRLLEWSQVDLERSLAWVHADQANAGKDISVPLNIDAMDTLAGQIGVHKRWVFAVPRWAETAAKGQKARRPEGLSDGRLTDRQGQQPCVAQGLHSCRPAHAAVPRPAPHLGQLACAGRHAAAGAASPREMGFAGDGAALRASRAESCCGLGGQCARYKSGKRGA